MRPLAASGRANHSRFKIVDCRLASGLGFPLPRSRVAVLWCEPGSGHVARFILASHESPATRSEIPAAPRLMQLAVIGT